MSEMLEVRGLVHSFGALRAVDGAGFTVAAGSIAGLIGPNGAGKSTTFDLITGRLAPDAGRVLFGGKDVTGWPSERLARQGLVRTFQVPRVFTRMSVWENLLFAAEQPGEGFWRSLLRPGALTARERDIARRAEEVLGFLELDRVADLPAAALSGGQRKLLELARVLMLQPQLILLDEPTSGVAPALTRKLADHLATLRGRGLTLVVVEHDLNLVMSLVDHLVVMHLGRVLIQGDPDLVTEDQRVLDAYLGGVGV
ncbi:MAG: ABC transporter ATP-binding protein [Actinomycetota bacterium]|nr:ABC transporter ATP-binding protein [Actinomycetota bacterium]